MEHRGHGNTTEGIQLSPTTYTCLHPLSSHLPQKTELSVERQRALTAICGVPLAPPRIRDGHSVALQPEHPPASSTSGLVSPTILGLTWKMVPSFSVHAAMEPASQASLKPAHV